MERASLGAGVGVDAPAPSRAGREREHVLEREPGALALGRAERLVAKGGLHDGLEALPDRKLDGSAPRPDRLEQGIGGAEELRRPLVVAARRGDEGGALEALGREPPVAPVASDRQALPEQRGGRVGVVLREPDRGERRGGDADRPRVLDLTREREALREPVERALLVSAGELRPPEGEQRVRRSDACRRARGGGRAPARGAPPPARSRRSPRPSRRACSSPRRRSACRRARSRARGSSRRAPGRRSWLPAAITSQPICASAAASAPWSSVSLARVRLRSKFAFAAWKSPTPSAAYPAANSAFARTRSGTSPARASASVSHVRPSPMSPRVLQKRTSAPAMRRPVSISPRLHRPGERGPEVAVLLVEAVEPHALAGAHELGLRRLGEREVALGVQASQGLELAALVEAARARTRGSSRAARSAPPRRGRPSAARGSCRRARRCCRARRRSPSRRARRRRPRPTRACSRRGRRRAARASPAPGARAGCSSSRSRRGASAGAPGGRARRR